MFPLLNKTHYSIQKAFTKPEELAKSAKAAGYTACGIIDNCTLAGCMEFYSACKDAGIKPIFGCDFSDKEKKLIILAINLQGWKQLMRLVTRNAEYTGDDDINFVNKTMLSNDLIVISSDPAYLSSSAHSFTYDSVALELCCYPKPSDKLSYQILRALDLKEHLPKLQQQPPELFNEDLSLPDQAGWGRFSSEQIANLALIELLCESYKITQDPKLPHFECPDGMKEIDYLTHLCREGWKEFIVGRVPKERHAEYAARVKQELKVIELANLSGYFLIVWDFIKQARDKNILVGPGRGCFLPDTRVKLSDGNYCPISHISIGDYVIDAYGKPQKVYDTLEYDVEEEIVELEFANGKVIRCTSDHKFLTNNRGWVQAGELEDSDDIVEV